MSYMYLISTFISNVFIILLALVNVMFINDIQTNKIVLMVFNIFCIVFNVICISSIFMKMYLVKFENFSIIPFIISLYTIFTFFIDYFMSFGSYFLNMSNSLGLLTSFVIFFISKDIYLIDTIISNNNRYYL